MYVLSYGKSSMGGGFMRNRIIFLLLFFLIVSGCVHQKSKVFDPYGEDEEEYGYDNGEFVQFRLIVRQGVGDFFVDNGV